LAKWTKAIPESRDREQSLALAWIIGLLLAISCFGWIHYLGQRQLVWVALGISLTFAAVVWALRAATPMAALCGGMVCLLVTIATGRSSGSIAHSGLAPLAALFVFTFAATRLGRRRKEKAALAEKRTGRNAAQVIANLGAAGLLSSILFDAAVDAMVEHQWFDGTSIVFAAPVVSTLILAALCEATADTVSSEIGQAFGGRPFLFTTLRRVAPGTDGAVSVLGTVAGIVVAGMVTVVGIIGFASGVAGLMFDSLLGATVERRGWIGNDLVNFSSTVFAAIVALALLALR
jgi:uncharacterized protein (TIGR00297 family)